MVIKARYLLLLVSIAIGCSLHAQAPDSSVSNPSRLRFIGLPVVFSTPETSWGFGAAASFTYRWKNQPAEDRPSQVSLLGIYTLEDQLLLFIPFNIFTAGNKWNFLGEVGYYKYVYPFYGLGNDTDDEEEYYEADFPRLRLFASRLLDRHLYGGLYYGFDRFDLYGVDAGGKLEEVATTGKAGGTTSEVGLQLAYDSRDHIFYPRSGLYGRVLFALAGTALGSDYQYRIFRLDLRNYHQLAEKVVLAGRIRWEGKPGDPPFYNFPELGGHKNMRGVVRGRYKDRFLLLGQAELRWKFYKRWGLVTFGSLGKVDNDFFTNLQGLHWAAGAGIRFEIDRDHHLHMRADYAFSRDMDGFYFTVGEAF